MSTPSTQTGVLPKSVNPPLWVTTVLNDLSPYGDRPPGRRRNHRSQRRWYHPYVFWSPPTAVDVAVVDGDPQPSLLMPAYEATNNASETNSIRRCIERDNDRVIDAEDAGGRLEPRGDGPSTTGACVSVGRTASPNGEVRKRKNS